jgi:hypothetical protein
MLNKIKELNNMSNMQITKSKTKFLLGRSKGDAAELERLWNLYDQAYEKYTKRIDALTNKRDYELGYIWNEICKLNGSKQ